MAALLPGGRGRELARLLPELGTPAGPDEAGEARAWLFEQMLVMLEHLAESGPVALVIEDMHGSASPPWNPDHRSRPSLACPDRRDVTLGRLGRVGK